MAEGLPEEIRQRWHLDQVSCMSCVRALVPIPDLTLFRFRDISTGQQFTWDVSVAEQIVHNHVQANPNRLATEVDTAMLDQWLRQYTATTNAPAHPWHLPEQVLYQPGIIAPVQVQPGVLLVALIDGNARALRARHERRPFFAYVLTDAESLTAMAAARAHDTRDRSVLPKAVHDRLTTAVDIGFSGRAERATSVPSLDSRIACAAVCAALVARQTPPMVRVGDSSGIDALVRAMLPASVSYPTISPAPRHLTARSVTLATDVARVAGLLVAFPDRPCPFSISPTRDSRTVFRGAAGSTWATAALAIGLGASALIYLPPQIGVPSDWPLTALGDGWWGTS